MATPLLTPESKARLLGLLMARHGGMLRDERLDMAARLDRETVVVTLDLTSSDRTAHYRMEAAKGVPEDGSLTAGQILELCLDFLDWYLGEYFREDRELLLPLDWKPHRFGEFELLSRGDVRNPVLEDMADAWLRGERPDVPPTVGRRR